MKLLDRLKKVFGRPTVDEIVQEQHEAGEIVVPANREYRRAVRRWNRLKGPGYTRAMRDGRTQRVRD